MRLCFSSAKLDWWGQLRELEKENTRYFDFLSTFIEVLCKIMEGLFVCSYVLKARPASACV